MSRWQSQYVDHPFHQTWKQINQVVDDLQLKNDFTGPEIEEFSRIKKIVVYIQNLMDSSDKELVPPDVWSNFQNHCPHCFNALNTYRANRNIGHLAQANDYLTTLLTYLKPYVVDGRSAARASTMAQKEYQVVVMEHLSKIQKRSDGLIKALNDKEKKAEQYLNEMKPVLESARVLNEELFQDSNDKKSFSTRLKELEENAYGNFENIERYYSNVFSEESGIEYELRKLVSESDSATAEILNQLESTKDEVKALKAFYVDVFGDVDDQKKDEPSKLGLKSEIDNKKQQLEDFKSRQEEKYNTLVSEIESLIPGATTTGLATAYSDLKTEAGLAVKNYSRLFYGAIALLSITSFSFFIKDISLSTLSIVFLDSTDWLDSLKQSLQRIPFLIPIVWFTVFASKRRSEQHRLQQEYSHKEAIAKSYHAFKQQIDALGEDEKHKELMLKLLNSAIESIAFNASDTLDKKHGDNTPVLSVVDKISDSLESMAKASKS